MNLRPTRAIDQTDEIDPVHAADSTASTPSELPGEVPTVGPASRDEPLPDAVPFVAEEASPAGAKKHVGKKRRASAKAASAGSRRKVARADRFRLRDLLSESTYSIGARTGRLVLTILGTVLGIAALVVTIGLAQTAAGQINKTFDAVAATQVIIKPATARTATGQERATGRIPWDAEERMMRLNGVVAAGTVSEVTIGDATVSAVPVHDPSAAATFSPTVIATSPGALAAVRGTIATGRYFDAGHDQRAERVVVLGARAAERLGVNRVDSQPSIFIGDKDYSVIGILENVKRRNDLLDAVLIPNGTARQYFNLAAPAEVQVNIDVGAGPLLAEQAPTALDPVNPEGIKVQAPPQLTGVRDTIQADINSIFLALGAVALLVGGIGIANVTLLGVMERVGEIGLRRALGATKRNIGSQFVVESAIIGLLGGLIGAAIGVAVVVVVSLVKDWTPILDVAMVAGASLLGGVIGLAAGIYPALKAASIEPISALRGAE